MIQALEKTGYNPSKFDLTPHLQPERNILNIPNLSEDDSLGPIILHVNPPEIPKALALVGKKRLLGRKIIGVWAWETGILPKSWVKAQRWVDEIWASSYFLETVFTKSLTTPIIYTGYPCSLMYKNNKIDRKYELSKYSISDKDEAIFTVFTSFDENSSVFRKNPHGAVNAFQSAFENKTNVRLIIKLTGTRFSKKIPNIWLNDPRIHIVSSNLNENDIISLMKSCDCVISLHRAEGYGLLIAKALANGLPVISTNYSGPEDFIDCPNAYAVDYELVPIIDPTGIYKSKHGHWADPNIIKAAEHLKYIESLRINEREKKSSAAILWWKKNHTEKDFIAKIPKKHMKKIN